MISTGIHRRFVTGLALGTLGLAACGGGASDAGSTDDDPSRGATPARLVIEGFAFGEAPEIRAGDELVIVNRDGVVHTFTADDGTFDLARIEGGGEATIVIGTPGTYSFSCRIHPSMKGTLTVTG